MLTANSAPRVLAAAAIFIVLVFMIFYSGGTHSSLFSGSHSRSPSGQRKNYNAATESRIPKDRTSEIGRSSNATLGFERLFVLGFPERTDKRDAIIVTSSLTGFQVEPYNGIKGDDIPTKALPPGMESLKGGELGCWRGHMNALSTVVEKRIATAFIMEDDADWDVRLLSQMPDLAKGVRTISGISLTEPQHSPYGDDWDIIWPGHCGDVAPKGDDRRYIINNDPTVAPKAHQPWLMELKNYPEGTRSVRKAGAPICTFGYAVSLRGAQKILYWLAIKAGREERIDNGMAYLCRDGFMDMKCFSVEPMLFFHHRAAGSISKDSDIKVNNPGKIRQKGVTENIVLSARLNIEQMINGTENWVTQW